MGPATTTTPCSMPKWVTAFATAASNDPPTDASPGNASTSPPAATSSRQPRFNAASRRARSASLAPSATNRRAVAAQMPAVAPTIITTLPRSFKSTSNPKNRAAIDTPCLSRDPTGLVRQQEKAGIYDVLRGADAAERQIREQRLQALGRHTGLRGHGVRGTGRYAVDPYVHRPQLLRQSDRDGIDTGLRDLVVVAGFVGGTRRLIYNGAAAAGGDVLVHRTRHDQYAVHIYFHEALVVCIVHIQQGFSAHTG